MAIATLAAYKTAQIAPEESIPLAISGVQGLGRFCDTWTQRLGIVGVAPTTAVVPTGTTTGALGQQNGSGTLAIMGGNFSVAAPGVYLVCDRLSHQGGLSAIVTSAQTTNLPTAALTRYTDGAGVMVGLTIYTAIGSTGTTVTASYTNQAGTAGRTTPDTVFGGTNFNGAGRIILLPLQEGDTGVRSVQSVTVLATTGTAGNFGVTLFKPLYPLLFNAYGDARPCNFFGNASGGIPEVVDDACLFMLTNTNSTVNAISGTLDFVDH